MEITLSWPYSTGEWLAWLTALVTLGIGLALMIIPRRFIYVLGLVPREDSPNGVSEVRGAVGGMWAGIALACLLLAQPLVYLALGLAFFTAVIGRVVSFVADKSFNLHCVAATVFEGVAATLLILYGLQIVP